jgi:hypothetical protein
MNGQSYRKKSIVTSIYFDTEWVLYTWQQLLYHIRFCAGWRDTSIDCGDRPGARGAGPAKLAIDRQRGDSRPAGRKSTCVCASWYVTIHRSPFAPPELLALVASERIDRNPRHHAAWSPFFLPAASTPLPWSSSSQIVLHTPIAAYAGLFIHRFWSEQSIIGAEITWGNCRSRRPSILTCALHAAGPPSSY